MTYLQVEKRALEVWGSEEEVERQIELRQEKQKASKLKTFKKKIKGMNISYLFMIHVNFITLIYFRIKNVYQKQFIH